MNSGNVEVTVYTLRTLFIAIYTSFTFLKISNYKGQSLRKFLLSLVYMIVVSMLVSLIKEKSNYFMSVICFALLLSTLFSKITESNIGYTILTTIISLSINYIIIDR